MESRAAGTIYDQESPDRAEELLAPLAAAGSAEAQFYLGHLADEGSPRRPEVALAWYRLASAGGFSEAKHWVASFLYYGKGAPQDIPAALALFRECAMAGDPASQWKLGEHLCQFPDSRPEGTAFLHAAAAQGHPVAAELLSQQSGRET